MRVALHAVLAALGHGPALPGAVQRDVDGDVVFRVTLAALERAAVIGRENTTNESDNG
jgi:hypothetical protein